MIRPIELKKLYDQGENISSYLRNESGQNINSELIIELSYDLQAGSYIDMMSQKRWADYVSEFTAILAKKIESLCDCDSLMEAGIGEATTFSNVVKKMETTRNFGFDLCWSRVAYAKQWLTREDVSGAVLCTGSLFQIPFRDNSIDVVYTYHALEPNGGNEKAILKELYRVAGKFLILMEPGYEFASREAQQRMDKHGYCINIAGSVEELGYKIIEHGSFPLVYDDANPSALTVIEKNPTATKSCEDVLACPQYRTPLEITNGALYSAEAQSVYPIVAGIPCLRSSDAIVATKFQEITFKV